jgi:hypothetical protein
MLGLGSSAQLGIGIAIALQDQVSGNAARVNAALLNMKKNAHSAVTGAITDYRKSIISFSYWGSCCILCYVSGCSIWCRVPT